MVEVALLLGGNRGDMESTLRGVRADIEQSAGTILRSSSVVMTKAWGFECDDMFANQALIVGCAMEPLALLDVLQAIERKWGRDRQSEAKEKEISGERYTSRTIDIDIILYGESVIDEPRLKVPHPLMQEREFVMEPLCQVVPRVVHPVLGVAMEDILRDLK